MDNLPIPIKEQKLNFIKRMKLHLAKRNKNLTFEKYASFADYIKKDTDIIYSLLRNNVLTSEELKEIPKAELAAIYKHTSKMLRYYRYNKPGEQLTDNMSFDDYISDLRNIYKSLKPYENIDLFIELIKGRKFTFFRYSRTRCR